MHNQKELIIVKISGASLKGENDIINIDFLNEIARQIKELSLFYKVAIVLGGGNIWRGAIANQIGMQRYKADQMGMLATVMNSLALQSALSNIDVKAKIFSTIEMEKIVDSYIIRNLEFALDNNYVAILSCGTGRPYFTTDTGIAVSAAELGATYIMMGKNSVDGVYDSDPNINKNAKFFDHLTYTKAIEDQLEVMDVTAASILKQCNVKTIVFKINEYNAIINTLNKKSKFTLISENVNDLSTLKFSFKNLEKNKKVNEKNLQNKNLNIN
ncbi:MAG: UMP kinase, partial [Malacoplasma sp.]|nr:UMP kinase [Malacoplasma sp.]